MGIVLAPAGGDAAPERICWFRPPGHPRFQFAFKSSEGRVYVVDRERAVGSRIAATVIAEHCDTEARAFGFVQTFLRGFVYASESRVITSTVIPEVKVT